MKKKVIDVIAPDKVEKPVKKEEVKKVKKKKKKKGFNVWIFLGVVIVCLVIIGLYQEHILN